MLQHSLPWYGIRTKSNFEKPVAFSLECKGFEQYLPQQTAAKPLFPGYVFCRFDKGNRVPILSTPGVVSIVGFGNEAAPIPDDEIQAVQRMLSSDIPVASCPFLSEGDRVVVRSGSLQGVEGILVRKKSSYRFVVSINMLQRSVMVELDQACIQVN